MSRHLIGHLDCDCFYVSAERVRYSHLRGVPVGVLGNQGACVIAKSYEMKARGVKTGTPIWDAVKLCPDGIYVKRDFYWYEALSRKILATLEPVSPRVEFYSIDEMFFDASELPRAFGCSLPEATAALQQRILADVGVPVSIGVAPSKSLAKLASDSRKPFGCTVLLDRDEIAAFLKPLAIAEAWGIGGKSAAKLAALGIVTCEDFVRADRQQMLKLLTVKGEALWWELRGESVLPIITKRPPHKILSRGGSVGQATADDERLFAWIVRNAERLVDELAYHQVCTSRLSLWLEHKQAGNLVGRVRFAEPTASFPTIVAAGKDLLHAARQRCEDAVHYMHLLAERLTRRSEHQLVLFADGQEREDRAAPLKRQINAKLGRFVLRSGDTLALPDVYRDDANDFDICDVRGKMCF